MARVPFHTVGVVPFTLGAVFAWKIYGAFNLTVFVLGILAVVLIMLTTYTLGEYYDLEGDRLSARLERNQFSGGSQAVAQGIVPPSHALTAGCLSAASAIGIGLVLQFCYHTGPWTIPLGVIGLLSGFFYSAKPVRLVKRGIGEIVIGFCYGWLPVATAFYLQTSRLDPLIHWMSIPIALTIFCVILINQFPDYPADIMTGKKTLAARLGKKSASRLYALAQAGAVAAFPMAILAGAPGITWAFFPIVAVCCILPAWGVARGKYRDRQKLERICAATIVSNLFIPAAYIAGILLKE